MANYSNKAQGKNISKQNRIKATNKKTVNYMVLALFRPKFI